MQKIILEQDFNKLNCLKKEYIMSDKTSTLKKPIKNGKKFFLLYSAAFLVCAALCYFWFIINKKTLIINSDG